MAVVRKPRSVPRPAAVLPVVASGYQRLRAFIVLFFFVLFFSWLLFVSITWSADLAIVLFGWSMGAAFMFGLLVSAVELGPFFVLPFIPKHEKRTVIIVLLALSLPFAVWDAVSSSAGLLRSVGWPDGWLPALVSVGPGMFVSFAPERVLALTIGLMFRTIRSR